MTIRRPLGRGSLPAVLSLVFLFALSPATFAATYYVSVSSGDDLRSAAEATSASTPWKTITRALVDSVDGDTISVAAGIYDAAAGETLPIVLKSGVAIVGNGAATTSLVADTGPVVRGAGVLLPTTRLSGFTLSSPDESSDSLLLLELGDGAMEPVIENNVFDGPLRRFGLVALGMGAGGEFRARILSNTFSGFGQRVDNAPFPYGHAAIALPLVDMGGAADVMAPTISANTFRDNARAISGGDLVTEGPVAEGGGSFEPVISGNLFQNNALDVFLYFDGAGRVSNFAPLITENSSTASDLSLVLYPAMGARDKSAAAAFPVPWTPATLQSCEAGVTVFGGSLAASSTAGSRVSNKSVRAASQSLRFAPTITLNNASSNFAAAYSFSIQSATNFEAEITISNNVLDGGFFLVISTDETDEAADTIVIAENIVTMTPSPDRALPESNVIRLAGAGGFLMSAASSEVGTKAVDNLVTIRGNHISGMAEIGLDIQTISYSNLPIVLECNTITGNGEAGIVHDSEGGPNADFGGGGFSLGMNNIYENGDGPFVNLLNSRGDLFATGNYWGLTDPSAIDATIYDNEEGHGGTVFFEPFLSELATCSLVVDTPDLTIVKSVSTATVEAGVEFLYNISVTNNGTAAATNVTVTDVLPAGLTLVDAGGCTEAAGTVTCAIGTLAPAATVNRTFRVVATTAGTVVNIASVSMAETDGNPADNASSASVEVTPAAEIPVDVPTMSEWMLLALGLALVVAGSVAVTRRTPLA